VRVSVRPAIAGLIVLGVLGGCTSPEPVVDVPDEVISSAPEEPMESAPLVVNRQIAESFQEPWPITFTREDQIDSSLARTRQYFETNSSAPDFELFMQTPHTEEDREWVQNLVMTVLGPYADLLPEKVNVIVGWDPQFMVDTAEANGLPVPSVSPTEPCVQPYGACSKGSTVWLGSGAPLNTMNDRVGFARMFGHKTFHVVQDLMDPESGGQVPPRSQPNFRPAWWTEGSADFMAFAVGEIAGIAPYEQYLYDNPSYKYFSSGTSIRLELGDLEELESANKTVNLYQGPPAHYLFGQVAMEHIVASLGYQPIVDVYLYLAEGKSFEQAFELSIGVTLTEFYTHISSTGILDFKG